MKEWAAKGKNWPSVRIPPPTAALCRAPTPFALYIHPKCITRARHTGPIGSPSPFLQCIPHLLPFAGCSRSLEVHTTPMDMHCVGNRGKKTAQECSNPVVNCVPFSNCSRINLWSLSSPCSPQWFLLNCLFSLFVFGLDIRKRPPFVPYCNQCYRWGLIGLFIDWLKLK